MNKIIYSAGGRVLPLGAAFASVMKWAAQQGRSRHGDLPHCSVTKRLKQILLLSISLFPLTACQKREVNQDLGNGFSMTGTKDKGEYTIKKNGMEVARIDLNIDHLEYEAFKSGAPMGHLSTPLNDSSGRGCSAILAIPSQDGGTEIHQVIERRLIDPRKDSIIRGAAAYITNAKPEDTPAAPPTSPTQK